MTSEDIILSDDAHYQIRQVMKDAHVVVFGETNTVRLLLATEPHQAKAAGPGRPQGATTLAVDMDRETAYDFAEQLYDFAKRMGWPPLVIK